LIFKINWIGVLLLTILLTSCSSEQISKNTKKNPSKDTSRNQTTETTTIDTPKITYTDEEQEYVQAAYSVSTFIANVFDGFKDIATDYERGNASVDEMDAFIYVSANLEMSIEELPKTPQRFSHIRVQLDEALLLFEDGIMGVKTGMNQNMNKEQMLLDERAKMNKAVDLLVSINQEIIEISKQNFLEDELSGLELAAEEQSQKIFDELSYYVPDSPMIDEPMDEEPTTDYSPKSVVTEYLNIAKNGTQGESEELYSSELKRALDRNAPYSYLSFYQTLASHNNSKLSDFNISNQEIVEGQPLFNALLTYEDGDIQNIHILLTNENDHWLIDDYSIHHDDSVHSGY
jgi:hypothetical protein